MVGSIQLHDVPAEAPGASITEEWRLELSTWDKRNVSIAFSNDDDAHRHAVLILAANVQMIETIDAARRDGKDLAIT